MGRTARDRRQRGPRPVEKIELDSSHAALRLALAAVLLVGGIGLILYSINGRYAPEEGWTEIEASSGEANCSGDFTFLYPLGTTGSPRAENRELVSLYSSACEDAYRIFTNDESYEDTCNIRFLNDHPNEEMEVDPALYEAFSLVEDSGDRSLYLAPLYEVYDGIFYCDDQARTADFDPLQNDSLRQWFSRICELVMDPGQVGIELLGENRVKLTVSEEYLSLAKEEEITSFIDFYWMKNAFITDYLTDRLNEAGFHMGTLSSFDGFSRNLDSAGETDYSLNIYDRVENEVRPAGVYHYQGELSLVSLRNYPLSDAAARMYFVFDNGEIRTPFLDQHEGICKSACNDLTAVSKTRSCGEILLSLIPVYVTDTLNGELLTRLEDQDIWTLCCRDGVIYHTDETAELTDLYTGEDLTYTKKTGVPPDDAI